jgi:hypothetical protein
MARVGRHSEPADTSGGDVGLLAEEPAPVAPRPPRRTGRGRQVATYGLGTALTALAWCVLVYLAIQLGPDVKDGEPRAWVLMVVAAIGAMACLFLALILGGQLVAVLRGKVAAPPRTSRTPPGGRRAKR